MIIQARQDDKTQEVSDNLDTLLAELDRVGTQANLITGLNIAHYGTAVYGDPVTGATFFGGTFASIPHGLGYTPVFKVWYFDGSRFFLMPFTTWVGTTFNYTLIAFADNQNLYFALNLGTTTSISASFTLRYYLFRDPLG